jgi:hypothetical protein
MSFNIFGSILLGIACFTTLILYFTVLGFLGFRLRGWYFEQWSKLAEPTRSKLIKRNLTVYPLFFLPAIIVFFTGLLVPSIKNRLWLISCFGLVLIPAIVLSLFDYYALYRHSKDLQDELTSDLANPEALESKNGHSLRQ